MTEVWKSVVGWEGFYEVSNLGNVRSMDREIETKDKRKVFYKGRVLCPYLNSHGRFYVSLWRNNKDCKCIVSRLVGLAFIDSEYIGCFDHKDRDPSNNKVCNLRKATHSQNGANKDNYKGSSKYKGACLDKRRGLWRSYIKVNQRQIWLGYFPTQGEAAQAYNKAALQHFGEFARINEI